MEKTHSAAKPQCEKLLLAVLASASDQVCGVSLFIEAIARTDLKLYKAIEFVGLQTNKFADHIGNEVAVPASTLKPYRQ